MYINNEDFEKWMEKLSKKLGEIGKDLKALINTNDVFDQDEKLLDNQDLAFLLKVSCRTLQRYRSDGVLPFFKIGHKTYYRAEDIKSRLCLVNRLAILLRIHPKQRCFSCSINSAELSKRELG